MGYSHSFLGSTKGGNRSLLPQEQETVISWNKTSKFATIYTTIPADMRRVLEAPDICKRVREDKQGHGGIGMDFKCEKRFITMRRKERAQKNG